MGVKSSPEVIRGMERDIRKTVADIQRISAGIRSGVNSTSWDDAKAAEFKSIMQQIARLTEAPVNTLNAALPKLEKLAVSLDHYNQVRF